MELWLLFVVSSLEGLYVEFLPFWRLLLLLDPLSRSILLVAPSEMKLWVLQSLYRYFWGVVDEICLLIQQDVILCRSLVEVVVRILVIPVQGGAEFPYSYQNL